MARGMLKRAPCRTAPEFAFHPLGSKRGWRLKMTTTHFFTGGTGFVGSNLILELLSDPGNEVYALTRAAGQSAEVRLQSALRHAARAAGHDDALDDAISGHCHAVEGDVHGENCGVGAGAFPKP